MFVTLVIVAGIVACRYLNFRTVEVAALHGGKVQIDEDERRSERWQFVFRDPPK